MNAQELRQKTVDQLLDVVYYARYRREYRQSCNMKYYGQDEEYLQAVENELARRGIACPVFINVNII